MEIKDLETCPVSLELEFQATVNSIIAGNWWDIAAGESDISEPELTGSDKKTGEMGKIGKT